MNITVLEKHKAWHEDKGLIKGFLFILILRIKPLPWQLRPQIFLKLSMEKTKIEHKKQHGQHHQFLCQPNSATLSSPCKSSHSSGICIAHLKKNYLKRKEGKEPPLEKGQYLQYGHIGNSIQRAHKISLNEQILFSRKLKETQYVRSLTGHTSPLSWEFIQPPI